jgi:hypothetical protein
MMSERPKKFLQMIPIRESLLKGKNQYKRPPGTKYFKSAPFSITKKYFFHETSHLNEDVNSIEPSSSARVPLFQSIFSVMALFPRITFLLIALAFGVQVSLS